MTSGAQTEVFVDTSAFYALVGPRDRNHAPALSIERQLRNSRSRLVTSNFVVAETHALVLRRENRDLAWATLQWIDHGDISTVRVEPEDEVAARSIIERYTDKNFSLVDATSFVIMEALGIRTAFAFDVNFRQYGFTTL